MKTPQAKDGPSKPKTHLGAKALVAVALVQQGFSTQTTGKVAGISASSASRLARRNIIPREHVDAVRHLINDRWVLLADAAMAKIDASKLDDSSAVELTRIASIASERVGLGAPSVHEQYILSISKYLVVPPLGTSDDTQTLPESQPDREAGHNRVM